MLEDVVMLEDRNEAMHFQSFERWRIKDKMNFLGGAGATLVEAGALAEPLDKPLHP